MFSREEAKIFSEKWLPAWTGNRPEYLASFYCENAFYSDPGIPQGVEGRKNIVEYFKKLLAKNPDWVWTQREAIPMENGFINLWTAKIYLNNVIVTCEGLCFVQLDRDGLIYRNEVYFDRSLLRPEAQSATN